MSDEKAQERRSGGTDAPALPKAALQRERRLSLAWLVPVVALVLAGGLVFAAWRERGLERAGGFRWETAAERTLEVYRSLADRA